MLVMASLCYCADAHAGLKIYYVRHGETYANAKRGGELDDDQNPVDSGSLTELGLRQADELKENLGKLQIDFIATSPRPRAMMTILPYLQSAGKRAEIWPELSEITTVAPVNPDRWPQPSPDLFTGGRLLTVPENLRQWFGLREEGLRWFNLGEDPVQKEVDKRAVAEKLSRLVLERFAGRDAAILMIGHGGNGRRFFTNILSHKSDPEAARAVVAKIQSLHNCGIALIEEQTDGSFKLVMLNGEPLAD